MDYKLRYSQYNERSILIEWPAIIDENILESILNFKKRVSKNGVKQIVDVIHTYNSILIIYDLTIENINDRFLELKALLNHQSEAIAMTSNHWEIPVCYDDEFGTDLEAFSIEKKMPKAEIIERHTKDSYTVFFIGFLPGFLYLGGLDTKLHLDRKKTPNLDVKKGAVGIGGQQTGIYPQDSPGGWHIIGQTPVELFNAAYDSPCPIQAGDTLKFVPIKKQTYFDIESQIARATFQLKPIAPND
ncbi:5-oxoprolinase subunit PxpB [Winogradskyella sp.]|uniref:5-oxoprolinase subunit PxpB n=1 Tax=Winogradskyella sp. TaxID=1883156 RepID=UPI003BAB1399